MELSGDWREQLGTLLRSARSLLVHHPSLVQLRSQEPVFRPEALRFPELGVRILQGAGFSASEAAMSFRLLFTFSFGYAAFTPAEVGEEDRAAARSALRALPPEEFPALTGVAEEAARAMGGEETFEYGLERLLDGLEARLAALS